MKDKTIKTHISKNGVCYFSMEDGDGKTIYSFTRNFEDTWTQEDEELHSQS